MLESIKHHLYSVEDEDIDVLGDTYLWLDADMPVALETNLIWSASRPAWAMMMTIGSIKDAGYAYLKQEARRAC